MRHLWITGVCLTLLVGCAALKLVKSDYDTGKATPLAEGELSPVDAANGIVAPVIPFLPEPLKPVAGIAVVVLTAIGTWRRGRKIRQGQPTSANPITGNFGAKVGLEAIVQNIANISQGAFEVGPEGSGLRRAWKVLLTGAVAAVSIPAVQEAIAQHPTQMGTALAVVAGLAALEKELSKVLPVKPNA